MAKPPKQLKLLLPLRPLTVMEQATLNYWRVSKCWQTGDQTLDVGQGLALLNEAVPGPHRKVVPLTETLRHDIIHNAKGPKEQNKQEKSRG